jgi:hypothetical protein
MGILESILTNINNITNLRNRLRTKLKSMYIVEDGASLEKCVESVENIKFYGEALSRPLNSIGASYNIPKGYHSGAGSVSIGSNAVKDLIPENLREGVVVLGVEGTLSEKAPTGSTFVNIIKNGSFETNEAWTTWEGENSFSTSEKYDGNRSFKIAVSNLAAQAIPTPIVGHKYYAREYIKSTGEINPEDCRFEIHGGDGVGLNWVIGWNMGNFPQWTMISGIAEIDVVNASSYTLRTFAVNPKSTVYIDGIMLIDLTACCGAGNEPSKEWCDLNIPYFDGERTFGWDSASVPFESNAVQIFWMTGGCSLDATMSGYIEEGQTIATLEFKGNYCWKAFMDESLSGDDNYISHYVTSDYENAYPNNGYDFSGRYYYVRIN